LSDCKFLCIDEGQDLHAVDYALLKSLFPKAVFNVFGDVNQVLHTECGVQNWEVETGINQRYDLTRNYRNTPAIVEFCNQKFGAEMGYIGKVNNENNPITIESANEIKRVVNSNKKLVIIVKNRQEFNNLCNDVIKGEDFLEYLDTNANGFIMDGKIACYWD
jgi:DNA helicase-2/ATP-dependent DNA helicase PcrA